MLSNAYIKSCTRFNRFNLSNRIFVYNTDKTFNQNNTLGCTLGEFNHPLLLTEMLSHQHYLYSTMGSSVRLAYDNNGSSMKVGLDYSWNTIRDDAYIYTDVKGNDLAHNNIQPSTVVVRWHRTA